MNVFGLLVVVGELTAPGEFGAAMGDGLQDDLQYDGGPSEALNNVCADGATLPGIDVSYYQGNIDWNAVAADGVVFALIRVSHSLQFFDPEFDANWEGARAAGVHAGVYQYFEPDEDPIAQADLLLDSMGPLMPGDLPPVIDVESTAGQSPAAIANAVQAWVEHVEAALGVKPIIYTGPYFWQDNVGSDAFEDYPLWIAHYGTNCPLTPTPWAKWNFHQYTDSGSTAGIAGNVDQNVFNGSLDELLALGTNEIPICGTIGPDGGEIDNGDDCLSTYGNDMFWREEAAGIGGSLVWTNATDFDDPSNYAVWRLWLEQAGEYDVEVHVDPAFAETTQAAYLVTHAAGETEVVVDQSAADGWVPLGTFAFETDAEYRVRLNDNTGESNDLELGIVYDALRLTPLDAGGSEESGGADETGDDDDDDGTTGGESEPEPEPEEGTDGGDETGGAGQALPDPASMEDGGCGCRSNGGGAPGVLLLGLLGLLRRRRR